METINDHIQHLSSYYQMKLAVFKNAQKLAEENNQKSIFLKTSDGINTDAIKNALLTNKLILIETSDTNEDELSKYLSFITGICAVEGILGPDKLADNVWTVNPYCKLELLTQQY